MAAFPKYSYFHATGATGTVVKASQGALGSVSINKALTGTVTIKNGSDTIAIFTNGTTAPLGVVLKGPVEFASLVIDMTTNAEDVTLVYE